MRNSFGFNRKIWNDFSRRKCSWPKLNWMCGSKVTRERVQAVNALMCNAQAAQLVQNVNYVTSLWELTHYPSALRLTCLVWSGLVWSGFMNGFSQHSAWRLQNLFNLMTSRVCFEFMMKIPQNVFYNRRILLSSRLGYGRPLQGTNLDCCMRLNSINQSINRSMPLVIDRVWSSLGCFSVTFST